MIHHHPSADILAEHAAGTLPVSHSLCVATHLENCASCRREFNRLSQVGAALFSTLNSESTDEADHQSLKNRIFDHLDQLPAKEVESKNETKSVVDRPGIPKALRQWIPEGYDELNWFNLTPAFKVFTLLKDRDGTQIALSRVKPGGKMGHHSHTGREVTVVLKGAFSDENGLYKKGDFVVRDPQHKHRPIVTRDDECICLMVTEAPIQFTGTLTRWLNPLLRWQHG